MALSSLSVIGNALRLNTVRLQAMHAELQNLSDWPRVLRWYLGGSLVAHLLWEALQLPLYTLWTKGTLREQAFAVLHCTVGDLMIAGLSLLMTLAIVGRPKWPTSGSRPVWLLTLLLGVGYTIYSEWLNVSVRRSWAYSDLMPTLPVSGTGLAPLLQWVIVPTLVLWIAIGRAPWSDQRPPRSNERGDAGPTQLETNATR